MKLLNEEKRILSSSDNTVVLTNYRIYMRNQGVGHASMISIFLEKISSVETAYKGQTFLLILAGISVIGGSILAAELNGSALPAILIGALFVLFWWLTRKHTIVISSDGGGKLMFDVKRLQIAAIEDFVTQVQDAKLSRINELHED